MVVPWQREESLLTTAKSLEQAVIDLRKQQEETSLEEIKRKEAEEGNGFASLSPRKNHSSMILNDHQNDHLSGKMTIK